MATRSCDSRGCGHQIVTVEGVATRSCDSIGCGIICDIVGVSHWRTVLSSDHVIL